MTKYNYKTQPYEHQRQALIQGACQNNYAYFMEMGTGKTKVSIDNVAYLHQQNKIDAVLVVAPNSVYRNWINEIETHCPVKTNIGVHKLSKSFEVKDNCLNFFLINVEAFSHDSGSKAVKDFIAFNKSRMCAIVDEATTIKNRQAKRTKRIIELCRQIIYKRILTGSPITKSPLDLFSQCEFLSPSLLGYDNYYVFRARYSVMKQIQTNGRHVQIPIYYQNLDELENKLKKFSYRVRKKDCLDLPDKIYQKRYVDLSTEQKKFYNDLKQYARTIIEDNSVSYNNKLTEIIKLQQVCNGHIVTNSGEKKVIKDSKLDELMNILEETDGKIIIWARFVYNIENIIKKIKEAYGSNSVVAIYGGVSVDQRTENVKKFQEDDKVRFFVGNPVTGGYGLNLTKANTVIYYNNTFDLEVRVQSEDRAHRLGQKKSVTYIDIIARGTIDEFVIKALNNKLRISADTLGEEVMKFL